MADETLADERRWTCEEFEKALPELFAQADGGKLSADPRFVAILRDCPQAADLVRDLEYIAEAARLILEPEGEMPGSDLWDKIQNQISTERTDEDTVR